VAEHCDVVAAAYWFQRTLPFGVVASIAAIPVQAPQKKYEIG
jgi:hypothetical protein